MDSISVIERLGSFGLLAGLMLVGLRWALQRFDKMLDQNGKMVDSFRATVDTFKAFEEEQRRSHSILDQHDRAIIEKLDRVITAVERPRDANR